MKKLIVISLFAMLVLASCNLMQGDGVPTATVAPVDVLRTSAASRTISSRDSFLRSAGLLIVFKRGYFFGSVVIFFFQ